MRFKICQSRCPTHVRALAWRASLVGAGFWGLSGYFAAKAWELSLVEELVLVTDFWLLS